MAAAAAIAVCGCRAPLDLPPLAEVEGRVTLDGQPVPRGMVQFVPDKSAGTVGPPATGFIDATGEYALQTAGQTGAMVGFHRVVVEARAEPRDETDSQPALIVPSQYTHENQFGVFPPDEIHGQAGDPNYASDNFGRPHCDWDLFVGIWMNLIFPHIEQQAAYDKLEFEVTPQYTSADNREVMQMQFELFLCPSDPYRGLTTNWGPGAELNRARIAHYYADGSVHFVTDAVSKQVFQAMATRAGGEVYTPP